MSKEEKVIIIMADDNDDDKAILKQAFERANLDLGRLILADNGTELMEKLASDELKGRSILILLDLNMPHKNGYQALKEIKQKDETQRIPVIIWTTSNRQEDIDQCYVLGANSYIVKPDRLKDVIEAVRTMWVYWIDLAEMASRD
jgi:CheY-like chemotaxis protein